MCGNFDRSQKEWQIRVKSLWKALPSEIGEKIEQACDSKEKSKKGRKILPNSDYEVRVYICIHTAVYVCAVIKANMFIVQVY